MSAILRHILSILLLPFLAVVVIPRWLFTSFSGADTRWESGLPITWLPRSAGLLLIVAGLLLFCWCVSLFARVGKGTLAPWDPTDHLVAVGPYRVVRNPMIIGVTSMLAGQALFSGSWLVGAWTCLFVLINHLYFLLSEEPGLEKRFGKDYRMYKTGVPRWIPRVRPRPGK